MLKWYSEDVLVIKTKDVDRVTSFLSGFGLIFCKEQHGKGPIHYSATSQDGKVIEIYPRAKNSAKYGHHSSECSEK